MLGRYVGGAFDFDEDGPGGWVILVEPGIELPSAPEIAPDVAGWRRERFAWPEGDEPLRLVSDWVCEALFLQRRLRPPGEISILRPRGSVMALGGRPT